MLSFFRRDVFDKIWDLIGSVSEGFPTSFIKQISIYLKNKKMDLFYRDANFMYPSSLKFVGVKSEKMRIHSKIEVKMYSECISLPMNAK